MKMHRLVVYVVDFEETGLDGVIGEVVAYNNH